MRRKFRNFMAALLTLALCAGLFGNLSAWADGSLNDIIIVDEESDELSPQQEFCTEITTEKVKVGQKSYRSTTAAGSEDGSGSSSEHWLFRSGNSSGGLLRTLDISAMAENGAVRFWIYVEDTATLHNWNGSQVQFGSGGWDRNTFAWSDWHKQIVNNGWNEIILPFSNAGKMGEVDTSLMSWFFIRTNNPEFSTTIYVDDIRVTADANARSDNVILANAELENEIEGTGFCAGRSDEKAASGKYSYKATPGIPGGSDHWILRGNIPSVNISGLTANGTDGALRFIIYVEDISTVTNWGKFVVQFGSGSWDTNVYQWQPYLLITKSGWNEIVLPFTDADKLGSPDLDSVNYINMRTDNVSYFTTVFVDDICVTSDTAENSDVKLFNDELFKNTVEGAELVTENPYSGDKSLKSVLTNNESQQYVFAAMLDKKFDLSSLSDNGDDGALRFKFYVKDTSLITDMSTAVSLKSTLTDSKFTWVDWEYQITENGWNEIILPFATAGKVGTPDVNALTYMNIRTGNASYMTVAYIDNIRVSVDTSAPEHLIDPSIIFSDEDGENAGFCAALSNERAKFGDFSYKVQTGVGNHEYWMIRNGLARTLDITSLTNEGTDGYLKFWIYIEDISVVPDMVIPGTTTQVQLGAGWDNNVYIWDGWHTQIKVNGWNEITLPFSSAGKNGNPNNSAITYMLIRTGNVSANITAYIDNIHIEAEKEPVYRDPEVILSEEHFESGGFCAEISYNLSILKGSLKTGWNYVTIPLSCFKNSAITEELCDITAINFFRIYTNSYAFGIALADMKLY